MAAIVLGFHSFHLICPKMSRFAVVETAPAIELFALAKAYREDPSPLKVDLGIGAYRNNEGKPWVLPVVRKAEAALAADQSRTHEYLGQLGLEKFTKLATELLLGADSRPLKEGRAFGVQALSGTGAVRLGADFLGRCAKYTTVYISNPSWPAHRLIFNHAGFPNIRTYRYWDPIKRNLNIEGMLEDLDNAPEDSIVILHVCAHNQTGIDPTAEQWRRIADVVERRKLFPFFDCAYQGFASGDPERDSFSVRYFIERGFELFCAQSFAKNFGLYNERVGNLTVVVKHPQVIANMKAQLTLLVRGNYSNPPAHGVSIVAYVLSDPQLTKEWKENIKAMSGRIGQMRTAFRARLEELGTPGDWSHITSQIGMFSYTGLTALQAAHLGTDYHIYLPKDGRISVGGLNTSNVDHVASSFKQVITKYPSN